MKVAEFFVELGLKGMGNVSKGLSTTKQGITSLTESSLAAKAAIVGMVYGLERLTGFASQWGADLHKFGVVTGLSTEELQRWQYAAMKTGVAGEEMASAIVGVQDAVANMKLGKGMPEGFGLLDIDPSKLDDTYYVMTKVEEFVKTVKDPAIARNLAKSLGISENVFQALKTMNRERDRPSKFQIISDNQREALRQVNSDWLDFWFNLKKFGADLVAQYGGPAIRQLKGAFNFLRDVTANIKQLMVDIPELKTAFVVLGGAIALAFAPLTTLFSGLIMLLNDIQNYRTGKDSLIGAFMDSDNLAETFSKLGKMSEGTVFEPIADIGKKIKDWVAPEFVPPPGMLEGLKREKEERMARDLTTQRGNSGLPSDSKKPIVKDVKSIINVYGNVGDAEELATKVDRNINNSQYQDFSLVQDY